MIGTIANCSGIMLGGVAGLINRRDLPGSLEKRLRALLALVTLVLGMAIVWQSIQGPFLNAMRQLGILLLSLMLGNMLGYFLRLQRGLNRLGAYARNRYTAPGAARNAADGFVSCAVVFCLNPLGWLGAVDDGLTGSVRVLALKTALDGFAAFGFARRFGWGAVGAVVPLLAIQGTLTLLAQGWRPGLERTGLIDPITAVIGFLIFTFSLLLMEIRRVEVANYLPALFIAPALTAWWR